MRVHFIINPISGKTRLQRKLPSQIEAFLEKSGWSGRIHYTRHPGHAFQLSTEACLAGEVDLLVAVGGDGTFNEVARVAMEKQITVGLIPCGSGNGLARHLGIPLNPAKALGALESGVTSMIDVGSVNNHYFFNMMGLGLDAQLGKRFNQLEKRGLWNYLKVSLPFLLSYSPSTFRISKNGTSQPIDALLIAVGNGSQYGNNAYITPMACVCDGKLDLTAVPGIPPLGLPLILSRLFLGHLHKDRSIVAWQGDCFRIECPEPAVIHTDGEVHLTGARIEVTVIPKALRILAPHNLS